MSLRYQKPKRTRAQQHEFEIAVRMEILKKYGAPKNAEDKKFQEQAVQHLINLL